MRHTKILMMGMVALGFLNGCNNSSSGNARRPAASKVDCTVPNPPAECNSNAIPGGSTTTTTTSCEAQTSSATCATISGCSWNGVTCVATTTTTTTPVNPVVTQPSYCTPLTTSAYCAAAPGCTWDGTSCKMTGLAAAPQPTSCTALNSLELCSAGMSCKWNGNACTRPGVILNTQFAINDGLSNVGSTNVPGQNCNFSALFRSDGNFVVFQGNNAIWSTATSGKGATRAHFQGDGNFVIATASTALFNTATAAKGASGFVMGSNGNLAVVNSAGSVLWESKTTVAGCY